MGSGNCCDRSGTVLLPLACADHTKETTDLKPITLTEIVTTQNVFGIAVPSTRLGEEGGIPLYKLYTQVYVAQKGMVI